MNNDAVSDIYQQMILEHNKKPRNFRKIPAPTHQAEGYNPLCGDHFNIYLIVKDGIVEDLSFEGSGCAISKSSASMMTAELKGKTTKEALDTFEAFHSLLTGKLGDTPPDSLGKLKVFSGIWKYPSRVKCASLSWHAMKNALNHGGEATTE